MEEQVVDAEVVPDEPTSEVAVVHRSEGHEVTLFGTSDPHEVVQRTAKVADELRDVLRKQGLTVRIGGKEHVQVEGWQTVGSMVGVFPVPDGVEELPWPEPVPDSLRGQREKGLKFGFKAKYLAKTLTGAVVGGGEAECNRTEGKPWTWGADFQLRSMAQTRATSKALKTPLSFIVTMAGYAATPAEEMAAAQPMSDVPPFGVAITKDEAESLARGLVFLTGSSEWANHVYAKIEADAGYIPRIAARAILHTARVVRDNQQQEQKQEEDTYGGE